jgi:proteic killer suppression protein
LVSYTIEISKFVVKELKKLPEHVVIKLRAWVNDVEDRGLPEVKKISGYHDEPVKGKERRGQRSIRLSKAYRAFYTIEANGHIHIVKVIEVNKHVY